MEDTKIEWASNTFNPWIGCTKVSSGCANCYAEAMMDTRMKRVDWGRGKPRVRTTAAAWAAPLKWNRAAQGKRTRPRVFCASLADWLDPEVPVEWCADLLALIAATPNLDWLLLTKRIERWHIRMLAVSCGCEVAAKWLDGNPPHNVWMGVTAEDQTSWDKRVPQLMDIPARLRFVSAEPLLGPIQMGKLCPDWVIAGGENGPRARALQPEWVDHLRWQCAGRAVFSFRDWGRARKDLAGTLLAGRTWYNVPSLSRRKAA